MTYKMIIYRLIYIHLHYHSQLTPNGHLLDYTALPVSSFYSIPPIDIYME